MNRITVGCQRQKSKAPDNTGKRTSGFGEDAVTAIGLCMLCLMLLVPVSRDAQRAEEAVMVMSTNAADSREILREIDEPAVAAPEEESVFEWIGELFAHLIFGE